LYHLGDGTATLGILCLNCQLPACRNKARPATQGDSTLLSSRDGLGTLP